VPVVAVEHLRKTYRDTVAVDDVSFEVEAGEIFGIVGPNGSGKTTTVECLQGLRLPDGGSARVLGLDPATQGSELRTRIGSQLQESALPDRLRVWEALDLFAAMSRRNRDGWRGLAEQWGLWEKRNAAFATLSGGQRQRLFIALALVNSPELVFLDEMTAGLDPTARRTTWDLIRAVREQGTTVVLVTHFMDEAEHLCDRIAVYGRGRIIAIDTPAGLVAQHGGSSLVHFTLPAPQDLDWIGAVAGVQTFERDGMRVRVRGTGPLLAQVAAALVGRGIAPDDLGVERDTLEDVYLKLTAGAGRE
jgi:ABC-2 type transport system ATP-binding protein